MNHASCRIGDSVVEQKSVLLADRNEIFRAGLRSLLDAQLSWLKVVAEAGDCHEAFKKNCGHLPDIIIIDSELPPFGGLEAARRVVALSGRTVLILGGKSDDRLGCAAIEAGARGFVPKSAPMRELLLALRAVAAQQTFISRAIGAAATSSDLGGGRDVQVDRDVQVGRGLTAREREVLKLLADGRTSKEIARELEISGRTVETHRSQIMCKLLIHTTAELTKYAIRHGMTTL
jgi:DNA-binding NarL/FixJ family response regulator